jgi:hypothetical protein
MSLIKAIKAQLGLSVTPANNFTLDASADNGTMKLARNSGQDIMTVDAAGKVAFPATPRPAFKAYASAVQSAANGPVKLNLQLEEFDVDGAYDAPNSRFQPTTPGYYHFDFAFQTDVSGAIRAALYKNGAITAYGSSGGTSTVSSLGSNLLYMNGTTDYVELWGVFPAAGSNVTQGAAITYLSGHLARAA